MTCRLWSAAAVLAVVTTPLAAQSRVTLDSTLLAGFRWRNIGPANMGGRVSSVTGIPSPSKTFFVAAAAGRGRETHKPRTTFQPPLAKEQRVCMCRGGGAPSHTLQGWGR